MSMKESACIDHSDAVGARVNKTRRLEQGCHVAQTLIGQHPDIVELQLVSYGTVCKSNLPSSQVCLNDVEQDLSVSAHGLSRQQQEGGADS